jgi:hypothetical protein
LCLYEGDLVILDLDPIPPEAIGAIVQILQDLSTAGSGSAIEADGDAAEQTEAGKREIAEIHLELGPCPQNLDPAAGWPGGANQTRRAVVCVADPRKKRT